MISCPACSADNPESGRFCSECGAALTADYDATHIGAGVSDSSVTLSDSTSHHGRFLPGTKVAGRYRIVSLIGKGGMGEVYRADDLKLGHTVALKFLPDDVAENPQQLEYFHSEVRLTRQISHPNVCRVYDIGETDGQQFLSMEYIDGEDLRVLLRRIGRLPPDKGVQIAQQLCAGLAAAHEKGVLHRDLKPANIMIDGRGQVRITDFGLARIAGETTAGEIAGTPAYMAPEQLARGEATIQSDLYALGLILYELFTGKRVHSGDTIAELMRAHEESSSSLRFSFPEDVDPAVQRVIARCLEKEPHERPKSVLAVAAALPGGDPLAAALAAGETPSPEMVAAAGDAGRLSVRSGTYCVVALLASLSASVFLSPFTTMQAVLNQLPEGFEPRATVSVDVQDEILAPLGYYDRRNKPSDFRFGIEKSSVGDNLYQLGIWYRQLDGGFLNPQVLELSKAPQSETVSRTNPSPFLPGSVSVRVDPEGKLVELLATSDAGKRLNSETLEVVFERAGLHMSEYFPTRELRNWEPPTFAETVTVYRHRTDKLNHGVIVAENGGRLSYFFAGPLVDDVFTHRQFENVLSAEDLAGGRPAPWYASFAGTLILVTAIVLGLRNLQTSRADPLGAFRFVAILGAIQFGLWVFGVKHVLAPDRELFLLTKFLRSLLGYLFRQWFYYLAIEPYVRRYWPHVLIAWSRGLHGRLRDPLVGCELLLGAVAGAVAFAGVTIVTAAAAHLGSEAQPYQLLDAGIPLHFPTSVMSKVGQGTSWIVYYSVLLLLFRMLLRDSRLAVAAFALFWMGLEYSSSGPIWFCLNVGIWFGGVAAVLTRFGLLAGAAYIFSTMVLFAVPLMADPRHWYGAATYCGLGTILALALYGFFISADWQSGEAAA